MVNVTLDTEAAGTTTVAVTFCPVVVAAFVTVVPAAEAVGVTNSCNTALAPLTNVPTFHIPVTLS